MSLHPATQARVCVVRTRGRATDRLGWTLDNAETDTSRVSAHGSQLRALHLSAHNRHRHLVATEQGSEGSGGREGQATESQLVPGDADAGTRETGTQQTAPLGE